MDLIWQTNVPWSPSAEAEGIKQESPWNLWFFRRYLRRKHFGSRRGRSGAMPKSNKDSRKNSFKDLYPAIAEYVSGWGWIEVGRDERNRSFVRALDEGGLVWEAP